MSYRYANICFLCVICLLLTSCKRDITEFEIDYQFEFSVKNDTGINSPVNFPTPPVETESEQEFENNNTRANLVEAIRLRELVLAITDPPGHTFSFLESVHIYINTEGEKEILLAYREDIPDNIGSVLELKTTDDKLDPYIKAKQFSLRAKAVTDESTLQDITIRVDLTFLVRAKTKLL